MDYSFIKQIKKKEPSQFERMNKVFTEMKEIKNEYSFSEIKELHLQKLETEHLNGGEKLTRNWIKAKEKKSRASK